jgi:TP901 family phage tail tape measure protein
MSAKAAEITLVFNTADTKRGGGEVTGVFDGIIKNARQAGTEVTRALDVDTARTVRNLGQVENALKRLSQTAKSGRLEEVLRLAEKISRTEITEAQKAIKEKERLQADADKRAQRALSEKTRAFERAQQEEQRIAERAARERQKIEEAELKEVQRIHAEKVKLAEREAQLQARAAQQSARRDFQAGTAKSPFAGALGGLGSFLTIPLLLAAAAAAVIKFSSDYETAMAKVAGLTSSTVEEMKLLNTGVLELSKTVPQSAKELAEGLFFIKSAGFAGADALHILEVSAKASAAGLGETKTVAEAVTSVLAAYKLRAEDASHVTDILTAAVTEGKVAAETLAPALGRILPLAAAVGVNFEQVAASMATMTRVGLNADEAATALRATLAALERTGGEANRALQSIGLSSEELRHVVSEKGLLAALQLLMERTHGNIEVLEKIIPNIRALTGVLATAGSQSEAYAAILDKLNHAEGRTEQAFQTASQTFAFQAKLMLNQLAALAISVGQYVLPVLTGLLGTIGRHPALFAAAATAVLLLVAAYRVWNGELLLSAAAYIPQLIANIKNLITVMFSFSQVTSLSATGLVSFGLGWGAVIALLGVGLGLLINWLSGYETATASAEKITLQQVDALGKQYKATTEQIVVAGQLAKAQSLSRDEHERLNAIILTLDPNTQNYIKALGDEKQKVEEVTRALREKAEEQKAQLQAQALLFASAALETEAQLQKERASLEEWKKTLDQVRARNADISAQGFGVTEAQRAELTDAAKHVDDLNNSIGTLDKTLAENSVKMVGAGVALGLSREQLMEFYRASGFSNERLQLLSKAYDRVTGATNSSTGAQNANNAALNQGAAAADNASNALKNLQDVQNKMQNRRRDIEAAFIDIIDTAKPKDAARLTQNKLDTDEKTRALVEQERQAQRTKREVDKVLDLDGGAERKAARASSRNNPIVELTNSIKKLRAETEALTVGGGRLFDLQVEHDQLESEKRLLTDILKLRRDLDVNVNAQIPQTRDAREAELRQLQRLKAQTDELTKLSEAQLDADVKLATARKALSLAVVSVETRAQTAYVEGLRKRRDEEAQVTADLAVEIKRRADLEKNSLGDLERAQATALKDRLSNETKARADLFKSFAERQAAFGNQFLGNSVVDAARSTQVAVSPVVARLDTSNQLLTQIASNTGGVHGAATGSGGRSFSPAEAKRLIESQGYFVTSTTGGHHNVGSLHYQGRAADVRIRNLSMSQRGDLREWAESMGFAVRDETTRPKGQKVWGGPHYHLSWKNGFNPGGMSAPISTSDAQPSIFGTFSNYLNTGKGAIADGVNFLLEQQRAAEAQRYLNNQSQDVFGKNISGLTVAEANALAKGEDRKKFFAPGTGQMAQERADLTVDEHQLGLLKEQQAALERINHERLVEVTNVLAIEAAQARVAKLRAGDPEYVKEAVQESQRARLDAEDSTLRQLIALREEDKNNFINSEEFKRAATERAEVARRQAARASAEEIVQLEDKLAHQYEDTAARYRKAQLEAIYEVRDADVKAVESQIASQIKLADASVLHTEQVRAAVLGHLAEQKSITQAWADGINNAFDSITSKIDAGIDKITHGLSVVDDLLKAIVNRIISNVFQRFLDAFFPQGGGGGGGAQSSGGTRGGGGGFSLGGIIRGIFGGLSNSNGAASTPPFAGGAIPGLSINPTTGAISFGNSSNQFAGQNILSMLNPGAGVFGPTLASSSGTLTGQIASQAATQEAIAKVTDYSITKTGAAATTLGGGKLGIGGQLAAMAPLLGLSLGTKVGGQSVPGQILGGAGGLLAGGSLAAFFAPGIFGTGALGSALVPFLTNPFTIAAAGALLVGSYFLGKSKQRKKDETARDEMKGDALGQIDALIKSVRLDQADGADAVKQALAIKAQYFSQVSQLKTKSVRNSANNFIPYFDDRIRALEAEAQKQIDRKALVANRKPEFATGGFVPGPLGTRQDIAAHGGELILNNTQQKLSDPSACWFNRRARHRRAALR